MASEASSILDRRAGARGGAPAKPVDECILFSLPPLLSLPPALFKQLWPAERVVVGLRVCKQLRKDLMDNCASILLVQKVGAKLSVRHISKDLRRLPKNLPVTLKWNQRNAVKWLVGSLGECMALAHLDLGGNDIGREGASMLAGALMECTALAHLDLSGNDIGAEGAESLAGVLGGCTALTHLDLSGNGIRASAGKLAGVLGECKALAHLNLSGNGICDHGVDSLAGMLRECKALAHLDLSANYIGAAGAGSLAGVLVASGCTALAHLDLSRNYIGAEGWRMVDRVLRECKALAHLNLIGNHLAEEAAGGVVLIDLTDGMDDFLTGDDALEYWWGE
eukprot:2671482-Rhodomonas_salina.8